MVENIVITKQGSEASNPNRTTFDSTVAWSQNGGDLIVYKNGSLQVKNADYSIIGSTTVEFYSSLSISDRVSFVVTKFLDPSGIMTDTDRMVQLDRVAKKLDYKTQTSITKRPFEETIPSDFIVHKDDVWASDIDTSPATAKTHGIAFQYTFLQLKEDTTVANHKGWYATGNNQLTGRIKNWIPPKFGQGYYIRLFDSNNNEIMSSDPIGWTFDYQAGYLFVENSHSKTTPFKLSGYVYTGSIGTGNITYWKPPVYDFHSLPVYNNDDGDVRLVLTENRIYRWRSIGARWETSDYGSGRFKDPVAHIVDLPPNNNTDGDIRLAMETNELYRWNSIQAIWQSLTPSLGGDYYTQGEINVLLSHKSDIAHNHDTLYYRKIETTLMVRWRASVADFAALPPYTENLDGDVILTRDDNTIYRWYTENPNTGQGHWRPIIRANTFWLESVATHSNLPETGNDVGNVHLVEDENIAYWWDGAQWVKLTGPYAHDHNDIYYTKTQTDALIHWKIPVATFVDLPSTGNIEGDARLTLDNNNCYRWQNSSSQWILWSAAVNWREPINSIVNLPLTNNRNNDIRFVRDNRLLYSWDSTTSVWRPLPAAPHHHDGVDSLQIDYNSLLNIPAFYWKTPVAFASQLPALGNQVGDAKIVLDEKSIYVWTSSGWQLITSGVFTTHNHDERYYKKDQIDALLDSIVQNFNAQLALKADVIHIHDDRYYTETEINAMFNVYTGHDHDGINSKRISYDDLLDVPSGAGPHDHDDRYFTRLQLATPGDATVDWANIVNVPPLGGGGGSWKTPVQSIIDLPVTGNTINDLRQVFETSDVYEWDGSQWILVGHWTLPGPGYWELPVASYNLLPTAGSEDGDVRLTLDTNRLYRWNAVLNEWTDILCTGSGGATGINVQVYLNGINLKMNEEWRVSGPNVELLVETYTGDRVTILLTVDEYYRKYEFVLTSPRSIFQVVGTTYYRADILVTVPQTVFNLDTSYPVGQNYLLVWLNGLLQKLGVDYTEVTPSQFRMTNACEIDDRLIVILLGYNIGNGSFVREDQVSTAGQAGYILHNSYQPASDRLLVYLNGVLQKMTDEYIEISPTKVRFIHPNVLEDLVSFVIIKSFTSGGGSGGCGDACSILLGTPDDGNWEDGLLPFTPTTKTCNAIDDINEALLQLAPSSPESLDGKTLITTGLSLYSGYTSALNTNYETFAGDHHNYLTENTFFNLITPDTNCFGHADIGVIQLFINGSKLDEFSLYNAFVESSSDGQQSATSYGVYSAGARENEGVAGSSGAIRNSSLGYISVMSITKYNDFKRWQKGQIRINVSTGLLRQGYNSIYIVHAYDAISERSNTVKLFLDTANTRPEFGIDKILEQHTLTSVKYISGIRYYSIGDQLRTMFDVFQTFDNTYCQNPVVFDMPGLQTVEIEYDDVDLTGHSSPPKIGEPGSLDKILTLNKYNDYSINAVLHIQTADPFGPGEAVSTMAVNRLVNTFTNGSTDLIEYFRDEIFRLLDGDHDAIPSPRTGQWNGQTLLTNGQAVIYNLKLKYPQINYTSYVPVQVANYSSFTGPQKYYRTFYKYTAKNSGAFTITGITKDDLMTNKILIDIKLPTQTGWLSLNKDYDIVTFTGTEGDGCLLNSSGTSFTYSSGTFSTANSGYLIIVRITLPNNAAPEISYMELGW